LILEKRRELRSTTVRVVFRFMTHHGGSNAAAWQDTDSTKIGE
jgi:hypothetical protein